MVDRGLFDKKGSLDALFDPRWHSQTKCVSGNPRMLPSDFHPGNWDVICHSGKDAHNHGNNLQSYVKAKSRSEKSAIISEIVTSIRESSTHAGGFVRLDSCAHRWYEVGDKVARDKVGQTLRDSSNAKVTKKRKREAHLSQVLPSTYSGDDHMQPSSKEYSSRLQPLQETKTVWVVDRVRPNYDGLSIKVDPLFYDSRRASATKLAESTTATGPLDFQPNSKEDNLFEGMCRKCPANHEQAFKEFMELHKSLDVGLGQDDIEWFEADMRAT
eukprot:scaffold2574_cov98-Cylindrotheca_fusiformis.AAC.9